MRYRILRRKKLGLWSEIGDLEVFLYLRRNRKDLFDVQQIESVMQGFESDRFQCFSDSMDRVQHESLRKLVEEMYRKFATGHKPKLSINLRVADWIGSQQGVWIVSTAIALILGILAIVFRRI